jgi:hypothetical protein
MSEIINGRRKFLDKFKSFYSHACRFTVHSPTNISQTVRVRAYDTDHTKFHNQGCKGSLFVLLLLPKRMIIFCAANKFNLHPLRYKTSGSTLCKWR